MTKVIIELRDFDVDGIENDNSKAIKRIADCATKFWNCESVEVVKVKDEK